MALKLGQQDSGVGREDLEEVRINTQVRSPKMQGTAKQKREQPGKQSNTESLSLVFYTMGVTIDTYL